MNPILSVSVALLLIASSLVGCKTPQTIDPNIYEIDRIIVLLAPELNGREMESRYTDVGLEEHGLSSRSQNRWTITFDTKKIKPAAMLERLLADPQVLEAEFVKKPG